MRINGKCNNSRTPESKLQVYIAFSQNPIFLKDQTINQYEHFIDVRRGFLTILGGSFLVIHKISQVFECNCAVKRVHFTAKESEYD